MAITITENAADRVKNFLANRGRGVGLKSWGKNYRLLRKWHM